MRLPTINSIFTLSFPPRETSSAVSTSHPQSQQGNVASPTATTPISINGKQYSKQVNCDPKLFTKLKFQIEQPVPCQQKKYHPAD